MFVYGRPLEVCAFCPALFFCVSSGVACHAAKANGLMAVEDLVFKVACWVKIMKKRVKSGLPTTAVSLTHKYVDTGFCNGNSLGGPQ